MQPNNFNQKRILVLMASLVVLGVAAIDIYISALPQMVSEFETIPTMINLTISAYTVGIAFTVLFIGEFSNRFGRRKVILAGTLCFSVSSLLISITSHLYLIICLRLIQAIGCSSFLIIPRLIIKDTMDEKAQINANGMLLLGMIISPAIAPVLGAYISKYLGWRQCFSLSALIGFLLLYIIYTILPETNLNQLKKRFPLKHYLHIYKYLLTNNSFLALTAIYATTVGAYFAFIGISSYLYIGFWHLSPIDYSYIYILLAGAYFTGNHIMRLLNHNMVTTPNIIGFGVYSAFIGIIILALSSRLFNNNLLIIMTTIGVLFMRAANAIIIPPTQIRIMNNFAPYSAQALGLNMCLGFIMNSMSTYLVTLLSFTPLSNLMIISILPILICVFVYKKYKKIL
ncbi:MAG: MFS transporter [Burkholderiales bacterium]